MNSQLVITIITDDRPGVVEKVAGIINSHQGNWLESALSRLGGKFTGILLADVPSEHHQSLKDDLQALSGGGIRATIDNAGSHASQGDEVTFEVIGNDRRGIVGEISHVLAKHGISVDELYTSTESAPMSGELLFRASASVIIPPAMQKDELRDILEQLSDDLMVEFFED